MLNPTQTPQVQAPSPAPAPAQTGQILSFSAPQPAPAQAPQPQTLHQAVHGVPSPQAAPTLPAQQVPTGNDVARLQGQLAAVTAQLNAIQNAPAPAAAPEPAAPTFSYLEAADLTQETQTALGPLTDHLTSLQRKQMADILNPILQQFNEREAELDARFAELNTGMNSLSDNMFENDIALRGSSLDTMMAHPNKDAYLNQQDISGRSYKDIMAEAVQSKNMTVVNRLINGFNTFVGAQQAQPMQQAMQGQQPNMQVPQQYQQTNPLIEPQIGHAGQSAQMVPSVPQQHQNTVRESDYDRQMDALSMQLHSYQVAGDWANVTQTQQQIDNLSILAMEAANNGQIAQG